MHESIVLGNKLFVVAGRRLNNEISADFIEWINLETSTKWTIFNQRDDLLIRDSAAISAISDTKFIVFGGYDYNTAHNRNDGLILDTQRGTYKRVLGTEADCDFLCST